MTEVSLVFDSVDMNARLVAQVLALPMVTSPIFCSILFALELIVTLALNPRSVEKITTDDIGLVGNLKIDCGGKGIFATIEISPRIPELVG